MNKQIIEQLLEQNKIHQCIETAKEYLTDHPNDLDIRYLLSQAHYQQASLQGHEQTRQALKDTILPDLKKIINQNNDTAVIRTLLDYLFDYETSLDSTSQQLSLLNHENADEYKKLIQQLYQQENEKEAALRFYLLLAKQQQQVNDFLKYHAEYTELYQQRYAHNRELRDIMVSQLWLDKVYFLASQQHPDLIMHIENGLDLLSVEDETEYLHLAEIAYEHQEITLAQKILLKLIKGLNYQPEIPAGLVRWYHRFEELIKNGYDHPEVRYYQIIIERNYYEQLNKTKSSYYQRCLSTIEKYPDEAAAFHFAGTYLYENKQYQQALTYLEKAQSLKPDVLTWRRWVESQYLVQQYINLNVPIFNNTSPRDLYAEGVNLHEFYDENNQFDQETTSSFDHLNCEIYRQSYQAFKQYYEHDQYPSDYYGDCHVFAMCCNNYAIQLIKTGQYARAAQIATEGLNYSEFMELHFTRIWAYQKAQDYQQMEPALTEYFEKYNETCVPFIEHQVRVAEQVVCKAKLGKINNIQEEAEKVLFQLYDHYAKTQHMDDQDYRNLLVAECGVEDLIYELYEDQDALIRKDYYESVTARYPSASQPYYVLMQVYNELEDYEKVNQYAYRYLEVKRNFMIAPQDWDKAIYLLIKSHCLLEQHEQAIQFYQHHAARIEQEFDPKNFPMLNQYLMQSFLTLNDFAMVHQLAELSRTVYEKQAWSYDDVMEKTYLLEAEAYYHSGQIKQAHQHLDHILLYSDHTPIAAQYKKSWKKPGFFSRFF
ncbi:hypothetical protein [Acinetobacter seifertii]|uniref:hypothetical protein n=1 Tax=Acinetobacter seifertii TaxID=1530123 RepID=UPI0032B5433C